MAFHPDWLRPPWKTPGVSAVMTTRRGGVSTGPYASMNVRDGVGDEPEFTARNRALLTEAIGAAPTCLDQVHGRRVARLTARDAVPHASRHEADACLSTEPGVVCAVQVADCLPVLFAAPGVVGAAHAGWRGLAAGVLEATLDALCVAGGCAPDQVEAWLGPCIGPDCFEVGADVLSAFGVDPSAPEDVPGRGRAAARFRAVNQGKWLADLPALARDRLTSAEVGSISGGSWCTVSDPSRFFSYRRDGVTGRMVAAIWLTG